MSVSSSAAICEMPIVTVSPSGLCHSCVSRYRRSLGGADAIAVPVPRVFNPWLLLIQKAGTGWKPVLRRTLVKRQLHNLRRILRSLQIHLDARPFSRKARIDVRHRDALLNRRPERAAGD